MSSQFGFPILEKWKIVCVIFKQYQIKTSSRDFCVSDLCKHPSCINWDQISDDFISKRISFQKKSCNYFIEYLTKKLLSSNCRHETEQFTSYNHSGDIAVESNYTGWSIRFNWQHFCNFLRIEKRLRSDFWGMNSHIM